MEELSYIPTIMPGEHLLGAFSRLHLLNMCSNQKALQKDVMGNNRSLTIMAAYPQSFDSLLELFGAQKTRERLLNEHSLMGFYRHSMKYQHRNQLLTQFDVEGRESIYLPGARIMKSSAGWRWCNSCVAEDERKHGISTWQVSHQLPSSITCAKHKNEKLLSNCSNCGFEVIDLRSMPLPPNGRCPECDTAFQPEVRELLENELWIQSAGIELYLDKESFLKPGKEYAMTYALGLITARKWKVKTKNVWSVYEKQQKAFVDWLFDNRLNELFMNEVDLYRCKQLDIDRVVEEPRKAPALAHLLWLRYMGVQSLRDAQRNGYVRPSVAA